MTSNKERIRIGDIPGVRGISLQICQLLYRHPKCQSPFRTQYTVICSEPNTDNQLFHCDDAKEQVFQDLCPVLTMFPPIVALFALATPAYLDVRPVSYTTGHMQIEIPAGYCLLLRGDIVHRGVKNSSSVNTYRLHMYIRPPFWFEERVDGGENITHYANHQHSDDIPLSKRPLCLSCLDKGRLHK